MTWRAAPAVDIAEKDNAYEVTAELPGMDEKNIEVNVANGKLTIKGEKQEEKEEKKKDYYLHERHFGSFQRSFRVPEGVDADKIDAHFKKGVLTVTHAQEPSRRKSRRRRSRSRQRDQHAPTGIIEPSGLCFTGNPDGVFFRFRRKRWQD